MTWGEFKVKVAELGVKDGDLIVWIDVQGLEIQELAVLEFAEEKAITT